MSNKLALLVVFLLLSTTIFSQSVKINQNTNVTSKKFKRPLKKIVSVSQLKSNEEIKPIINTLIPLEGLVGYYQLDENLYTDSSDSDLDLEIYGTGGTILATSNRFNVPDKAIYLFNEYVHLISAPFAFNFDTDSTFSLCVWIKIEESIFDWTAVLNNWNGFGNGGYYLGITPQQQVRWNVNGEFPLDSNIVSTDEWIHIVATYDGTTSNLWLNGNLVGSAENNIPIFSSPLPFTVGAQSDQPNNIFPGKIDDILVYERVLTDTEISDIFTSLSTEDYFSMISKISIHPNPTHNILNISNYNTSINLESYTLHNLEGRMVQEEVINNLNNTINISSLSSGVYFLNLKASNGLFIIKKLVKN